MEQFSSGWKRSYYGKGDVTVYRLNRDGKGLAGGNPVFGANILMLVYGDAFWPTYATGDNTGLIATDSMKNFIQRETINYTGPDLEDCCRFLGAKFLDTYPQVEGVQVSAVEIPYAGLPSGLVNRNLAFSPAGPERAHRAHRNKPQRDRGTRFGTPRLQAASPGRQRVSRFRAGSVHYTAGHHESSPAHMAGSGMALRRICRWVQLGRSHRRRTANRPRRV